jgi:hypothetical protein
MKQLFWAGALTLLLLALPSQVNAGTFSFGNCEVDCGANIYFNVIQWSKPVAGPWYLYWPYPAHFMTAAPGVNPYFPPPMTLPPSFLPPPPTPAAPPQATQNYRAPMPYAAQGYPQQAPQFTQGYPGLPPQGQPNPIRPQGYWYYGR